MEFTPWSILVDAGIIGMLLAVSTLLRAVIAPLQSLMVPASVIAGFLGLALGPTGLGWLPFSEELGTYAGVLIVLVFACLAMTDDFNFLRLGRSVGSFASYSALMYAIQVALGMTLALLLLGPLFDTPDAFGALLFAGWAGGFGSAAAIGQVFASAGQEEIQSLAFTSATVGLLVGIVGGIIQAKVGAKRGHVQEYAGSASIPEDLKTGVLDQKSQRPAIGTHTFSGSSVESLAFQSGIILAISAASYGMSVWLDEVFPAVAFPVFTISFIIGLMIRVIMKNVKAARFVDSETLRSISGMSTDILIVCGIASIVPTLVLDYAAPLIVLFVFGLAICLFMGIVVAPQMMEGAWFEKQMFTWGWATGAVATGIAVLRIVDPKLKSRTLEDFALAYIPVVPIEVTAVTFVPALVLTGAAWGVVGIWGAAAVVAVAAAVALRLTTRQPPAQT